MTHARRGRRDQSLRLTPGQTGTGRLCFTDRASVNGYDSPRLATRTGYDPATGTSQWSVAAGGRLGMVLGEDAVQNGCTV